MFHSSETAAWVWLIDQLADELSRRPALSRSEILGGLDAAAGYAPTRSDAALMPAEAKRRELVDCLLERLQCSEAGAQPARTLLLNEKFAKSVTLA